MVHIDEYRLELYVLHAESEEERRGEIEEHLQLCKGCRTLFGEISAFYKELDEELRKRPDPTEPVQVETGRALVKSRRELAVWEERLAMSPLIAQGSPVQKLRQYVGRHPVVSGGATFAFTALAAIGLMAGYNTLTTDVNPAYAVLNHFNGYLEVYNQKNDLLWSRFAPGTDSLTREDRVTRTKRHTVTDFDGDEDSEVLTTMNLGGLPAVAPGNLHIFDGKGEHRDIGFRRRVSFRGNDYEHPVRIEGGSQLMVDPSPDREPGIYVTVKNDRSPNALIRIKNDGEVTAEYWHFGQLISGYFHDVDGDGHEEIVLCGIDDVNDQTGPSSPVIIILDPPKLSGRGESDATRGFGYDVSHAEKYYIRLPLTEVNTASHVSAAAVRMRVEGDNLIFLWRCHYLDGNKYDLDFVFSKTLEPQRVISTTQMKELVAREFSGGRVKTQLDGPYLGYLKSQIRFWDGDKWRKEVVKVKSPGG
ncbi:MAG TPA: hypothetical protein VJO14_01230 [Bacteroidota bacterium]|nr:hypothetical protein [Bacteroidota bacterium]